jgi:hypothetical protein
MNDRKAVRAIINELEQPPTPVPSADGACRSSLSSSMAAARAQSATNSEAQTYTKEYFTHFSDEYV